jgi:putative aldouronate transport system substrate-binding protein
MNLFKPSRLLIFLLLAALILSAAACSGNNKTDTSTDNAVNTSPNVSAPADEATETKKADEVKPADPLGKYDTPITVTSVKGLSDNLQKQIAVKADVVEDNIWNRGYLKDLGIKVKYLWTVPAAQMEQKMNVAISSNDLPDIIPANARQFKMLVDSGVALDLTQLFEQYASPFTKEMMDADKHIAMSQATINGKLMALPFTNGAIDGASLVWIRADWLTKLNLQPPKTMADVLKISDAFTNSDPDGNGQKDTYGLGAMKDLFGGYAGFDGFFESYHAYANGWIKDSSGKLVFGAIQPEAKTALAKLADIYKAGQIDREFSIKDATKAAELTTAGKVGMVFGQHWIPFWPLQDSKNKNPKADWRAYPIVSVDDKPAVPMINGPAATFYVVNKNMKNPEAAIKMYNYYYAKDPAISKDFDPNYHGINGELETKPDQHFEWAVLNSFYSLQNEFIQKQVKEYFKTKDASLLGNFWIKDNVGQIEKYMAGDNTVWSAYAWSGPDDSAFNVINKYDADSNYVVNGYIKADTKSMSAKGATLKQLRDETFTKIIMGAASIDEFDKFVDKWKKLGGDDITIEVNQEK